MADNVDRNIDNAAEKAKDAWEKGKDKAEELGEKAKHRAQEAGARSASYQPQEGVRVMLDPDGHPFCLFRS